jgi:type VI secretion system secreted protein Hcp
MNYEGIMGDVTEKAHAGWIELQSIQIGPTRGGGREPALSEITITKLTDRTSPQFYNESLWGEGKNVTIDFVHADGTPYLRLELKGTLISGYSPGNSGRGTKPSIETLVLKFTKMTYIQPTPLQDQKQAA